MLRHRLPEGEESSPCTDAQGDEKSVIDMSLICDIDLMQGGEYVLL